MAKTKRNGNGFGTIYKYKNGYRCQLTVGTDENGKLVRKSICGKTKTEVHTKAQQLLNQITTGTYIDKSKITFYDMAKLLNEEQYNKGIIKDVTYFRHNETLKMLHPKSIDNGVYFAPLQLCNELMVNDLLFKVREKYSQSIVDKIYQLLCKTFKEAYRRKIINENIMLNVDKVKSAKAKRVIRGLSIEEEKKLLNILLTEDIAYSAQMLISMFTGARIGEINALRVSSYNPIFHTLIIKNTVSRDKDGKPIIQDTTKTQKGTRTLRIDKDIEEMLKEITQNRDPDELIFTNNGKIISTTMVNSQFHRLKKKYDFIDKSIDGDVDLHSLRHTYVTRCIESGISVKTIQNIVGHSDIKTTMNVYAHVFEQFQNQESEKASAYMAENGLSLHPQNVVKTAAKLA